ncbi:ATP-binding protein [Methylobacterium sp. Leaf123]|uniref:AlbA family DNA-binding domain-containing protein n=1 Tax=Methylobacterium sp. Leaf123 TaxID=1736264 RepID=UPI0009EAE2E6|nr:ATP-binding protein [Methylobacterium sp. Leaf123]
MFRKPLAEVTSDDIDALIARGAQEDRTLEFKKTLSTRDGAPDTWMSGQGKIGNTAKKDITKELIAFANTAGGTLILGIDEDGDARARGVVCVPNCRELADRLGASITASVDPPLTSLEVLGIERDGLDGVVVFRVPPSHAAPHRDKDERECYLRIGDKSVPMTMRQVQDLCVAKARENDSIRDVIEQRRNAFVIEQPSNAWVSDSENVSYPVTLCGLRSSAYPLDRVSIDEITSLRRYELKIPSLSRVVDTTGRTANFSPGEFPIWRPMLRGLRSIDKPDEHDQIVHSMRYDGLIDSTYVSQQRLFSSPTKFGLPYPKIQWFFHSH